MKRRLMLASLAVALAACESFPIPTSTTNPPAAGNPVDLSCMQDCQGANADAEMCRQRCAK